MNMRGIIPILKKMNRSKYKVDSCIELTDSSGMNRTVVKRSSQAREKETKAY